MLGSPRGCVPIPKPLMMDARSWGPRSRRFRCCLVLCLHQSFDVSYWESEQGEITLSRCVGRARSDFCTRFACGCCVHAHEGAAPGVPRWCQRGNRWMQSRKMLPSGEGRWAPMCRAHDGCRRCHPPTCPACGTSRHREAEGPGYGEHKVCWPFKGIISELAY